MLHHQTAHSGLNVHPTAPERLPPLPQSREPETPASGLPTRLSLDHPLLTQARRILDCAPTIEAIDILDDDVRIIAGMHALRRLAEEAAETLIALLDELEPDADLEPSLGFSAPGYGLDLEGDPCDQGEPDDDGEPWLGSLAQGGGSQGAWSSGGCDDREDEHDGREEQHDAEWDPAEAGIGDAGGLDFDAEPSLGWTTQGALGDNNDREATGLVEFDLEFKPEAREPSAKDGVTPRLCWRSYRRRSGFGEAELGLATSVP